MISKETIAKIIDAAEIVDVVGDFVALKRRGANYMACCPFHNEKTPSFSVSPTRGIFKCFGCGKGGNAINFVMEHEQVSYVEALKYLGKKYGIEVVDREESEEEARERVRVESIAAVTQYATLFFSQQLWESEEGQRIGLTYFKERGFEEEIIKKFSLGWAPKGRASFSSIALAAGYKQEFLIASGLSLEGENGQLYDRFYDRIIFPISSVSGRVIAFGGRTLRSEKSIAKYINSPEGELYNKSNSLYGIYQAKSAIVKSEKVYLVEGYTDVLAFHRAGVENVVASSGTSLTREQIRLIRRFSQEVVLLFDGDEAGIKASLRGIDLILEEGLKVKLALFPGGEDPDSYSKKHGSEGLIKFLESSAEDFIKFKSRLVEKEIERDPIKRAELIKDIVSSIALIPDAISRAVYIEECSNQLSLSQDLLADEVYQRRNKGGARRVVRAKTVAKLEVGERLPSFVTDTYCEPAELELLYYLIKFGEAPLFFEGESESKLTVAQFILSELQSDELEFQNLLYKKIFDLYFKEREKGAEHLERELINHPDSEVVSTVLNILHQEHSLTVKVFVESLTPEEQQLSIAVPKAILIFKAKITAIAYQQVCTKLEEAEREKSEELKEELMQQAHLLMQVRNSFSKALNRLTI